MRAVFCCCNITQAVFAERAKYAPRRRAQAVFRGASKKEDARLCVL